ncbi:hypothetical protein [Candidatus Lokiarchaeum ossiferum]|uniref:hypothetical protein n=1 Tax=Candidatus Lokiarchaeum ossiferum TaxID=2951803 RepID=UPI00352C4E10
MHSNVNDPNIKTQSDRFRKLLSKRETSRTNLKFHIQTLVDSKKIDYIFKIQISDLRILDCTEKFAKLIEYGTVQLVKQHYLQLDDLLSCEDSEFVMEEIEIFEEIPKMNVQIKTANDIEIPFILSAIKIPRSSIIICTLT